MERRIQEMLDDFEIRRVLAIYCHACDRGDASLMASVYAPEGSFDDHGIVRAPGPDYAREMTGIVASMTTTISHMLGQSIVQIDGDEARAETLFLALMASEGDDGAPRLTQLAGRFVDRLRRGDDGWKIRHRAAIHDLSATQQIKEDMLSSNLLTRGSRGRGDPGAALLGLVHAP